MKRVSRVRGRLHGLRETSDAEVREPAANELACRTFLETPQVEQVLSRPYSPATSVLGQASKGIPRWLRQDVHG